MIRLHQLDQFVRSNPLLRLVRPIRFPLLRPYCLWDQRNRLTLSYRLTLSVRPSRWRQLRLSVHLLQLRRLIRSDREILFLRYCPLRRSDRVIRWYRLRRLGRKIQMNLLSPSGRLRQLRHSPRLGPVFLLYPFLRLNR